MKSLRDIFRKMPETKSELEEIVLGYYPELKTKIEKDNSLRGRLEKITEEEYQRYRPYIGGTTQKISAAGHGIGYTADAYFLTTGDIYTALGGKAINLIAQIPEKLYKSISYAVHTGGYLGAIQNIVEGIISYAPGLTILDQGLSRIAQKRMLSKTLYRVGKEFGLEMVPWHKRVAERIKGYYEGVKDRTANIIGPSKKPALVPV